MVGWLHGLSRHEFEQTPWDTKGLESLAAAVHGVGKSWT